MDSKIKILVALGLILLIIQYNYAHAFYVSVFSISHNSQNKQVKITCKVFTNDLEAAIKKHHNLADFGINKSNGEIVKTQISDYLRKSFSIKINGNSKLLELKEITLEGEGVTETTSCHFYINGIEKVGTVAVNTSFLTEIYDDQVNIVNVRAGGKEMAINLDKRVSFGKLSF